MKKILVLVILCFMFLTPCMLTYASADSLDNVLLRWTKSRKYVDKVDKVANMEVFATYYSAEYVEAIIQSEAQKNLWTEQEMEEYKYNFIGALRLDEMIPINIKFLNNGPTMHLGPFDIMVKLRIGNKLYKPVDYDKRLNFKFQGEKEGLVYFPRYDVSTGKDLLKGVTSVWLELTPGISPLTDGSQTKFIWDVKRDDPSVLYKGKTADRFETDRLLKRLEKLRKDKAEQEKQLQGINEEISTVQKRLDELAKQ